MRWLFCDPNNPREWRQRQQVLDKVDDWWRAFSRQHTAICESFRQRQSSLDVPRWMQQHLQAIDDRLCWEFGPATSGNGHRLVITPESEHWLRPVVRTILERAPQLGDWEFYPYRLPEDAETAIATVEGRVGLDITGAVVEARIGECRKVDLCFHFPPETAAEDQEARCAAFVATESLVGEELLDHWIGCIELGAPAVRKAKPDCRLLSLDRVRPTVDALIGSVVEQLPAEPTWKYIEEANWSGVELHPEEGQTEYCARDDLFVAISGRLDVFEASHGGGIFASGCHSRCGETFCYLKIDGAKGLAESQFADRAEIEEALNAALRQDELGCCFGGGTGLRYSYVDLALTNLPRSIDVLRRILLAGGIPQRTWLQFFDDELAHEWVGIHASAPEPPMG
jgi:hypothetical protein